MAGELPPIIAVLLANSSEAIAALVGYKAAVTEVGDASEAAAAKTEVADAKMAASSGEMAVASEASAAKGAAAAGVRVSGEEKAAADVKRIHTDAESEAGGFSERLGGLFTKAGASAGRMGVPFSEAATSMGEKMGEVEQRAGGFVDKLANIGKVATVVTVVGLGAVAAESVNLAEKYQATTTTLSAQADISVGAATKIGKAFTDTAFKTVFSAQQMMGAYAPVAAQLATVSGRALDQKQAMQEMAAAMDLAEGSSTKLDVATKALAAVQQAYKLSSADAAGAADVLFNAARSTGNTLDTVAASVDKLHTRLGDATPALADVGGLMVDMATKGITGGRAISAMSNNFIGLIQPGSSAKAMMEQLGISFTDATGKFIGAGPAIALLQKTLGGLPPVLGDTKAATKAHTAEIDAQIVSLKAQLVAIGATNTASKTAATTTRTDVRAATLEQTKAIQDQIAQLNQQKAALSTQAAQVRADASLSTAQVKEQTGAISVQQAQIAQHVAQLQAQKQAISASGSAAAAATTSTGQSTATIREQIVALEAQKRGSSGATGALSQADVTQKLFGKNAEAMTAIINAGAEGFKKSADAVSKADSAHKAAEAQSKTLHHEIETLVSGLEDEGIKIGTWLIPKLQDLLAVVTSVINWFVKHKEVTLVLAGVIGTVLAGAIATYLVHLAAAAVQSAIEFAKMIAAGAGWVVEQAAQLAEGVAGMVAWATEHAAMAAAFIAENVAMAASAMAAFVAENLATLGIIAGIALLVAAVIWVATHWHEVWGEIKKVAEDAWHFLDGIWQAVEGGIRDFIGGAIDWLKNHWQLILAILTGPVGLAALFIKDHIGQIVQFFSDLPGQIEGVFSDAGSWLVQAGENIVNGLVRGIENMGSTVGNAVVGTLKHIPGVSLLGGTLGIPGFATGGRVTQRTLAFVGEDEPETIIPDSLLRQVANKNNVVPLNVGAAGVPAAQYSPQTTGGSVGGSMTVELTMNGAVFARAWIKDVVTALLQEQRVTGNLGIKAA